MQNTFLQIPYNIFQPKSVKPHKISSNFGQNNHEKTMHSQDQALARSWPDPGQAWIPVLLEKQRILELKKPFYVTPL